MKILLTGGSGLLGKEILKLDPRCAAPSHRRMDILRPASIQRMLARFRPRVVLHLAAATDPLAYEKDPGTALRTNILGTAHVALACLERKIRLVYTSTDYVYQGPGPHKEEEPVSAPYRFSWSKLGGEAAAAMCPGSLILRLSFGPVPFPWKKVYRGQYNSKLYADEMAPLVLEAARSGVSGILNLGGPRTTLEAYAKRTRPDIQTIPRPAWVPKDTSLDLKKMKRALGISDVKKLLKR